jgi:hypothetical protein
MFAGRSDFGTCAIKTYDHLKHTGSDRQLSINRYGACASGFELSDVAEASLGLWRQFLTTQALNRVYSDEKNQPSAKHMQGLKKVQARAIGSCNKL